jgi:hypothetical protein
MSGPIRLVGENLTCSQKGYAMSIVVFYDYKSWMGHSCNDMCHCHICQWKLKVACCIPPINICLVHIGLDVEVVVDNHKQCQPIILHVSNFMKIQVTSDTRSCKGMGLSNCQVSIY